MLIIGQFFLQILTVVSASQLIQSTLAKYNPIVANPYVTNPIFESQTFHSPKPLVINDKEHSRTLYRYKWESLIRSVRI